MSLDTIFGAATPRARQLLAGRARERRYASGTVVFHAGDEAGGIWLVLEGRVRVIRGRHGRPHVVHWEEPGGALGEAAVFGTGRYPATAEAVEETRLLFLGRDALVAAMREDAAVALALLARLSGRVASLVERFDRATGLGVRPRLLEWLDRRPGARTGEAFTLGVTQTVLAEELGTVREVVVRCLRELVQEGVLIRAGRGRYRFGGER